MNPRPFCAVAAAFLLLLVLEPAPAQTRAEWAWIMAADSSVSGRSSPDDRPLAKNGSFFSAARLIRFYQKYVSSQDMHSCVFVPSCSRYSAMSFRRSGFIRGTLMTFDRLERCHGLTASGYPVDRVTRRYLDPPPYRAGDSP